MNNSKKTKHSSFFRQSVIIGVLATLFVVLLVAFLIIAPYIKDDSSEDEITASLIWKNEVAGIDGSVLMFEPVAQEDISEINVHNPGLATTHGAQYVDWKLYQAKEDVSIGKNIIEKGNFYIEGYEYAPLYATDSDSAVASIINDAAYTLTLSRLVDHADDFSKYGLDFENEEDATYCEVVKADGTRYKFYVGDRIPSGTAYYVRMAGTDTCLDKDSEFYNTEVANDSVYIYDCTNVLISPTDAIAPILLYPMAGTNHAYFDLFTIIEYVDKDTKPITKIEMRATNMRSYLKNPLSTFSANAKYYSVVPDGYHSSSAFDDLFSNFVDGLSGISVKELAEYEIVINEKTGKEDVKYSFSEETLNKYFEDGILYTMAFSWKGIENIVDISNKTENNTYYVISYVYNTICEVSADTLAFLQWEQNAFIGKEMLRLVITDCEQIKLTGKYADNLSQNGWKNVDTEFNIEVQDDNIFAVESTTSVGKGNMTEKEWVENFRTFYRTLLLVNVKGSLTQEEISEIMKGEAFAELSITTRDRTASYVEPDDQEAEAEEIKVEGITRIYRFYQYSSGRCLMTIESIMKDGSSEGEKGNFYLTVATVEKMLKSAEKMANAEAVDLHERE
ncbi:MAG: DUF4340 domain-containing protein [Clostridia bacterium]|nr:DUF4340 domain-containing protein [Clostridia bacterium]